MTFTAAPVAVGRRSNNSRSAGAVYGYRAARRRVIGGFTAGGGAVLSLLFSRPRRPSAAPQTGPRARSSAETTADGGRAAIGRGAEDGSVWRVTRVVCPAAGLRANSSRHRWVK